MWYLSKNFVRLVLDPQVVKKRGFEIQAVGPSSYISQCSLRTKSNNLKYWLWFTKSPSDLLTRGMEGGADGGGVDTRHERAAPLTEAPKQPAAFSSS